MQISSKTLLNSAEGILKDRRNVNQGPGQDQAAEKTATPASGMTQGMIESRLLSLQDNLRQAQVQYSREQARYMYITKDPGKIDSSLTYEGEALFPELLKEGAKPEDLKNEVAGAMEQLARSLKSIQVEMENLYALNFSGMPRSDMDIGSLLNGKGMRELDPGRVSRLTRDS